MGIADPKREHRLRDSLLGLAVGDGFGECFFGPPDRINRRIADRMLPAAPWHVTDDTVMALGIASELLRMGTIDADALAKRFARNYAAEPDMGYGPGARLILEEIGRGTDWKRASSASFGGSGSMGNGGAMRSAPLGAYFADDPARAAAEADRSAAVTHYHPEGRAGAVAVALAAAWSASRPHRPGREKGLFEFVIGRLAESRVKTGIRKAANLGAVPVGQAVEVLGNGSRILAEDTVPFVLWCVSRSPDDYENALWLTISGGGDRDTNAAMVGGILTAGLGTKAIPPEWVRRVERLGDRFGWLAVMG